MSNSSDEQKSEDTSVDTGEGITDDQLPEDLRPTDDNPLAKPLDEDEQESEQGPSADLPDAGAPGAS